MRGISRRKLESLAFKVVKCLIVTPSYSETCMKNKCRRETAKFDFGHIEWKIQVEINYLN